MDKQLRIAQPAKCPLKLKQRVAMSDCTGEVLSLHYDHDDKFLAAACGDGQIRVFNAFTGKPVAHMISPSNSTKEPTHTSAQALKPTSGLGAVDKDQEIVFPYTCVRWRPPMTGHVSEGGHSQSSQAVLVTTQSQGLIQHWHVSSNKCVHTIQQEHNDLYALEFSNDGQLFAVAGEDTRVYLYDEATKQLITTFHEGRGNHTGHANRVFTLKFHPNDQNMLMSGGWDRTIQLYDVRAGTIIGSIFGPAISGDALDVHEDLIVAGSNRNKDVVQLFSLSKRQLIQNIEWEATSKKDIEAGFVYATKFSRPDPHLIFAGGAGRHELKVFENNIDGSASMRILATINEFESPCLSMDVSKQGENMAFGLQDGRIYVVSYKIDDLIGDFEGYQGHYTMEKAKDFQDERDKEHHIQQEHQQHQHMLAMQHGGAGKRNTETEATFGAQAKKE